MVFKSPDRNDIVASILLQHLVTVAISKIKVILLMLIINPNQDGGGEDLKRPKAPLTSFSPVTSTNVGISPQNFLNFSFNPFTTLA